MLGYAATSGAPDFYDMLPRPRLARLMGTAGQRAIILSAPSGYGKTVAASDFASSQPLPVIWLSATGDPADYSRCLVGIISLFAGHERVVDLVDKDCTLAQQERLCMSMLAEACPNGCLVVVDDVGKPGSRDSSLLAQEIVKGLRHSCVRVVVTTQQTGLADSTALVVDHRLLAFSQLEAQQMAKLLGRSDLDHESIEKLIDSAAGHPAVTTVLLAATNLEGLSEPPREALVVIRRMAEQLDGEKRRLLETLRFLRRVSSGDLERLGFTSAEKQVRHLASLVPLVKVLRTDGAAEGLVAVAHDMLAEPEHDKPHEFVVRNGLNLGVVLTVLLRNRGSRQIQRFFASDLGASEMADWLEEHSERALEKLTGAEVCQLLSSLPLREMVRRPNLMLLWASLLIENGQFDEAASKARVALRLAEQDRDVGCSLRSASLVVDALSLAGHTDEAWRAGNEYLAQAASGPAPLSMLCDVLASLARAAAVSGRERDFHEIEELAKRHAASDPIRSRSAMRRITRSRSTLQAITSEWTAAADTLTQLLADDSMEDLTTRLIIRGNLAICLIESGRLTRARGLLSTVIGAGNRSVDGSYLLALGMAQAGAGDLSAGIANAQCGIGISASLGDELDVSMSRLSLSCMQRAQGLLEDSLETAERAYEALGGMEVAGLREIAATEVAASLAAMDDSRAARRWLGLQHATDKRSPYRALRAEMVSAECDRREGQVPTAISRLALHADEIRSGNSNWQMAMYIRSFPHLLGMLTAAAGASELPIHMLKMVTPEQTESALRVSETLLPASEREVLGRRSLGEEGFAEHLQRKGRPMCRVRLFGGLEVCVDDRVVQERDWAKRKGRSIFAMLAARQGQELARDQILEHLWPDMDSTRAKNNFYVAWSSMKAALRAGEPTTECMYVDNARGRCRVVREWVRSDLDEFEELLATARTAESDGRIQDAVSAYSQLMTIYRGELLADDLYDDWFASQREHYRVEFLEAMLRATQLLLDADQPGEALMFARRGLAVDPYREDLYQDALRCHIHAGQRSAAIETFLQCKAQLADELGLDPSVDTLKLYEQVLAMEERSRYDVSGLGFLD